MLLRQLQIKLIFQEQLQFRNIKLPLHRSLILLCRTLLQQVHWLRFAVHASTIISKRFCTGFFTKLSKQRNVSSEDCLYSRANGSEY